jgi:hypothetical protein
MGWTRAGNAAHIRESVVSALEGSQEPIPSGWVAERSKARAWKVRIRQKRIVGSNPTPSARFSSRTGPSPENGLHSFEDFKGICEGDRTSETGKRPKIGL